MTPATGTCPRCKETQTLHDDGHMSTHDRANGWADGVPFRWRACEGTNLRPVEFTATARATRDRRLLAQCHAARDYATVALDAVLSGRHDMDAEIPKLLKLAAALGALTHPPAKPTTASIAKATRWWSEPWVAVNRRQLHTRSGRTRRGPDADIYCVFCGEMILASVDAKGIAVFLRGLAKLSSSKRIELGDKVYAHTTPCALQCLAGLRVPVAPGTRRIPSEFREERA